MSHVSQFYVPHQALTPGAELTDLGRRLWELGLPFLEPPDCDELPEDIDEIELTYAGMGIVFSEFGDPVPNEIFDLQCPHCAQEVMQEAYEAWQDETSTVATGLRSFACSGCARMLTGKELKSAEPFTFATCYLYVSDIDPDFWPDQVKTHIESVLGKCDEYREEVP